MLNKLYENIGDKIKNWAKWIFIVEAIGAIIAGFVLITTHKYLIVFGLLTLVCGPIVAWVSSWILYAFGQLVEDVHAIRNKKASANTPQDDEAYDSNKNSDLITEDGNSEKLINEIQDDNFIYIQCNNCKKEFAFQKGMRKVRCPWCNAKQD